MSTKVLQVIETGASKIRKAVSMFEQAKDKKSKAKAKSDIKVALKDYCNDVVIFMSNKDIAEDPYHVIYGKNLQHEFMVYMVMDCHYELRTESPEMADAIDSIMLSAVKQGLMNKWIVLYKNGKRAVVTSEYVKVVTNGVERCYKWTKSMLSNLLVWLKEKWAEATAPIPQTVSA